MDSPLRRALTRRLQSTGTGWAIPACLLFLFLILSPGCQAPQNTVVVFHAGSLSYLFHEVFQRFQRDHPGVLLKSEASGSLDAIRKITELNKPCDLIAVADARLIPRLLREQNISKYYVFLGNELVLATDKSSLLGESTAREAWQQDWYERLLTGEFSYGISDPDRDPAGYYSHFVWQLAEIHYQRPGLYSRFLDGLDRSWVRPKSSDLVALLEAGSLDFGFLYRSAAFQNNLDYLTLPAEVSLAEESYKDLYGHAAVRVAANRPGSSWKVTGTAIRYGIAQTNPANPWAGRLLEFVLTREVQQLYRELGYLAVPVVEMDMKEPTP